MGEPEGGSERRFVVKLSGLPEPIPLRSLGDGMNRVLGIVLALVYQRTGWLTNSILLHGLSNAIATVLAFNVAMR